MAAEHEPHGVENLCASGSAVYAQALREGRVHSRDAEPAPCLVDFGLLHPSLNDMQWLHPTTPAVALSRLLRTIEDRVAHHRRREERLTAAFEAFLDIDVPSAPVRASSTIRVLQGPARIDAAMDEAIAHACHEVLTIQPGDVRPPESPARTRAREQAILNRGGRLRTLYQHTTRHALPALAHFEQLRGDVEARSLDEGTERLFVFDRTVAFIPASQDHTTALEIRHTALIDYFVTTFERLWRFAAPLYPQTSRLPSEKGVTPRQKAIAGLLIEGLTDAEIAARLGMNIRTARVHIAKLAATLGSNSRAQLGYLIGQSGILDHDR
ncbi:LuxR C-terminal-related transcriptional regulator [Streptomyces sp. NPDC018029]|uniref:LuxR C-terminal-related transcriptional regulator n=1 Tax=Streptomyces sp. NPDC018029 TaxID=3365032 RepID=UPI0037BD90D9